MSPDPTAWPASHLTSVTLPAFSAVIWFSIFMASRTTTVIPTCTSSPTATSTCTIVPCIGATTSPLAAPPPLSSAGFGRALRAAPPRAAATGAPSGTHMATAKRRPSTSTSTWRRTRGSSSCAGGAVGAGDVMDDRSRRSSTHFVEYSAAMKSGWERMSLCAGVVVATPSMTSSSRAPSSRLRASSRSRPQTMSLARRLS